MCERMTAEVIAGSSERLFRASTTNPPATAASKLDYFQVSPAPRVMNEAYHEQLSVDLIVPFLKRFRVVALEHVSTFVPVLPLPGLGPDVLLRVLVIILKTIRISQKPVWLRIVD